LNCDTTVFLPTTALNPYWRSVSPEPIGVDANPSDGGDAVTTDDVQTHVATTAKLSDHLAHRLPSFRWSRMGTSFLQPPSL
jgi:hypothetical protein